VRNEAGAGKQQCHLCWLRPDASPWILNCALAAQVPFKHSDANKKSLYAQPGGPASWKGPTALLTALLLLALSASASGVVSGASCSTSCCACCAMAATMLRLRCDAQTDTWLTLAAMLVWGRLCWAASAATTAGREPAWRESKVDHQILPSVKDWQARNRQPISQRNQR
jgi:hypothetical protein